MKSAFVVFVSILVLLLSPAPVHAHFIASDQYTQVKLHVSPDDSPIAGEQATIAFIFLEKEANFALDKCDCSMSISRAGETIYKEMLASSSIEFLFPEKAVYTITINAEPTTSGTFEPFELKWDLPVIRDRSDPLLTRIDQSTLITYVLIVIVCVFVTILSMVKRKKKDHA